MSATCTAASTSATPRDELTSLAATLDGLLGRLDAALRHEQRFSAEVAHELRTPLSGLRGEAELALRGNRSDAELRAALDRVLAGTDRMAAVIDTLLAAARSEATGPPGSSDAAATIRQLRGLAGRGHRAARTGDRGRRPGPRHRRRRSRCVENALRHAERDVRVEVRRAGADVLIVVTDDGPGVADEDAERIFAPGFSSAGGAGLGLALSRRLARAAGGEVVVAGSAFELRLPSTARSGSVRIVDQAGRRMTPRPAHRGPTTRQMLNKVPGGHPLLLDHQDHVHDGRRDRGRLPQRQPRLRPDQDDGT